MTQHTATTKLLFIGDSITDIPWTTDGVHPASAGHVFIATQWLTTTGLL